MSAFQRRTPRRLWLSLRTMTSIVACLIAFACTSIGNTAIASDSPRIKRISLMTADLDQSIGFFTEVIGFTLDFEGILPANSEPFLGPVFNIDSNKPIRRALLSTATEPRGLFLIEHKPMPSANATAPRSVVTVTQVDDIESTLLRAIEFGSETSDVVSDVTPEGASFAEALIMSPSGHAILIYQYDAPPTP